MRIVQKAGFSFSTFAFDTTVSGMGRPASIVLPFDRQQAILDRGLHDGGVHFAVPDRFEGVLLAVDADDGRRSLAGFGFFPGVDEAARHGVVIGVDAGDLVAAGDERLQLGVEAVDAADGGAVAVLDGNDDGALAVQCLLKRLGRHLTLGMDIRAAEGGDERFDCVIHRRVDEIDGNAGRLAGDAGIDLLHAGLNVEILAEAENLNLEFLRPRIDDRDTPSWPRRSRPRR